MRTFFCDETTGRCWPERNGTPTEQSYAVFCVIAPPPSSGASDTCVAEAGKDGARDCRSPDARGQMCRQGGGDCAAAHTPVSRTRSLCGARYGEKADPVVRAVLLVAQLVRTAAAVAVAATSDDCRASSSKNLPPDQCGAWIKLYDATGGANWSLCSGYRTDPCACKNHGRQYGPVCNSDNTTVKQV